MPNPLAQIGELSIDNDNEALLISNAIKDLNNRELFSRKIDYREFRLDEFKTIAFAIKNIHDQKLDMNTDMILLQAKRCPVRKIPDFKFIEDIISNFSVVPQNNFEVHIQKLKTDSIRSLLVDRIFNSLYRSLMDPKCELRDIELRINSLKEIVDTGKSATYCNFKSMEEVMQDYIEMRNKGISKRLSGFNILDKKLTQGLFDQQISVLAAYQSMGKSSFALSQMNNLSHLGIFTAMFALEMNNMSLAQKLLSFNTYLPLKQITSEWNNFTPVEKRTYEFEIERLIRNRNIYLSDKPAVSLNEAREQIMILQDRLQEQYIVVYFDLFGKIRDFQNSDNFARDYENRLNTVQIMARELGVHICLVAQILRSVMNRKFKRPTLSDLKNTSALAEVADLVIGIHRPFFDLEVALKEQYTHQSSSNGENLIHEDPDRNLGEIIILKQRMGEVNCVLNFLFDPHTTRFSAIEESYQNELNATKFISEDEDFAVEA
jgi:replicative DNA helicase